MRLKLLDALDRRIGHRALLHRALDEPVPGGASWSYVFGSVALILFLAQLVTGVVLALYYSPSSTDAWASIAYLEREIAFGGLVRALHHHAASAMVVVVGLHAIQIVIYGAYRAPREVNWWAGLLLLGIVLAFALTGYLLPWDQTGYWATKVATSIAGTVPLIGGWLQRLIQGGNDYGNLTLTRFYALHVIVLPLIALALLGVHLALFRRHGLTPHPHLDQEALEKRTDRFWPKQVAMDAVASLIAIVAVAFLAVRLGAPLEAPADPSSSFIARPEWYFLFLFELLKHFEGPLEVVGTIVLPGLVTIVLFALPFLDRAPSRRIAQRKLVLGATACGLLAVLGLTAAAAIQDARDPRIAEQRQSAAREAARARTLAAGGVPVAGAAAMLSADPLTRGERVFRKECLSCHALEGHGPDVPKAPELTGYRSRAWIRQVLRDPDSARLFGRTKVEGMESFAKLPPESLDRLVDLVYSRRSPSAQPVAEHPAASLAEDQECTQCHELEEAAALEGPTLFRYQSEEWLMDVLLDPAASHLYGDGNSMPSFRKRLSEDDRRAVVAFLVSLEDRTPKDRWPTVDDPGPVPTPRKPKSGGAAEPSR